jgi:xanthine dehydrogenase small subunit
MATRDHLVLYLNGQRREVRGGDCFLSLSDYLRYRARLVGTKIVCSEGDCGSCTVLVGRPAENRFEYLPIDSCIRFMFQLDGVHVVTVEGLKTHPDGETCTFAGDAPAAETIRRTTISESDLTPVQKALVDCHGSQCGFCTPGFVMAMTGVCEHANGHAATEADWRTSLTGNLCRCTGYTSIISAAMQVDAAIMPKLNALYPPEPILRGLAELQNDVLDLRCNDELGNRRAFCPKTIDEAVSFRAANPQAKIVAGATDVGVQLNKRVIEPAVFLDLNRVVELRAIDLLASAELDQRHDKSLSGGVAPLTPALSLGGERERTRRQIVAGARATWSDLLDLFRDEVPEFAGILSVFGSPQIRHVGTIGGNIINASPIADSLPFLFVMEAELELVGPRGRRQVNINDFYQGYKKFDLRADELLTRVIIPLPKATEILRLYKISRRRDLDISTFTAAIRIQLDGETIESASIAYGAVGPTVLRLRKTEQFLQGQPLTEETMAAAGDLAVGEITPIGDVRGSKDYRLQLARNVLLKFYHEQLTNV